MDFQANYREIIAEHDPLLPFESGFKSSLDWLNRFEKIQSRSAIVFRTRSPLVILLAPVLKRFSSRIKLIIPIEALTDSLHLKLDPESKLPRPSERIHAAKALHNLGFDVELELRPFVTDSPTTYEIPTRLVKAFAKICDESANRVFLRKPLITSNASRTDYYFSQKLGGHLLSAKLVVEAESTRCAA
jgi:DNA repair photolyase